MKSFLIIILGFTLFSSQAYAQKIARSSIGTLGSSSSGKHGLVAFSPISSPVIHLENRSEGLSIQTKPFLHLKAGSRFQDIQVDIYPNPTHNWINIKTKETYTDVMIIDVFGKTCYTGWSDRISMQNLAAGMYTINLTLADKRVYSKKLVLIK
tara:strand:- start:221 stop:679 length:459 start_codon:yes stop_codon:yes gene_type:complete